jgi:hypothetical protein
LAPRRVVDQGIVDTIASGNRIDVAGTSRYRCHTEWIV